MRNTSTHSSRTARRAAAAEARRESKSTGNGGNHGLLDGEIRVTSAIISGVAASLVLEPTADLFPKTIAYTADMIRNHCPSAFDENGKVINSYQIEFYIKHVVGTETLKKIADRLFAEGVEYGLWDSKP